VNAGTALLLFAPLLLFGRHIEQRFDRVQASQAQIEERQDRAAEEIATLSHEVASANNELRRTREEIAEAVTSRLASDRLGDRSSIAAVSDTPGHDVIFTALTRAGALGLIADTGCRIPLKGTNLYLRFEIPQGDDYYQQPPNPESDLYLRLEDVGASELRPLSWSYNEDAEEFLIRLAEALVSVAQYPGDKVFSSDEIFTRLGKLLQVTYESATRGSFEPLTEVVEFCPPQWVITSTHLIAIDIRGLSEYAIPIARINQPRWPEHMAEKTWLDHDSFSIAYSTAKELFNAGRLRVKPPNFVDPPF
jgi:hypothetical protein